MMKKGKKEITEGIELPSEEQEKIRTLGEKENYKYLGILEADTIKQTEMKRKVKKEYLRRTRKLLETKLCSSNLFKGINTWAVPIIRYSGPFLKWTREELRQDGPENKETDDNAQGATPRDDTDRLYVSRKEGRERPGQHRRLCGCNNPGTRGVHTKEQRKTNNSSKKQ